MMREGLYSIIRLGVYELLKVKLGVIDIVYIFLWKKIVVGVMLGIIGSVIVIFIDLVKVRF